MTIHGIEYIKPQVFLLQESGIGSSEYAARTAYNSFDNSENMSVQSINLDLNTGGSLHEFDRMNLNEVSHSDLLDQLAWVHHHHSVLEHATLTYLIKGTSRGVLQEHARHRLQAITVQSTRYTMSSVINAFIASMLNKRTQDAKEWFMDTIWDLGLTVLTDDSQLFIEYGYIFDKLFAQYNTIGQIEFLNIALSKENQTYYMKHPDVLPAAMYKALEAGKKKRNIGDPFKHIVTDNWKVDMVVTFNLRSLKNYFDLRDSGAAYFQIQWLAQAMKDVTPEKYLKLIVKEK